jgi:hypothetical protein
VLSVGGRSVVVMTISSAPGAVPAVVLDAARAPVLELADRLVSGWSDDELVEGMSAVQRLRGAVDALELSMLAEVDVRELPRKRLHWGSTADWFTHLTGGFDGGLVHPPDRRVQARGAPAGAAGPGVDH